MTDSPEESCTLDPQVTCKHVTKLVPQLKQVRQNTAQRSSPHCPLQVEKCFDVPKEVCVRSEVNPRKVAVPVVKKWCYQV